MGGNELLTCTPFVTKEFQYTFLLYSILSLYAAEVSEEMERFLAIVVCDEKSRQLPGRTLPAGLHQSASSVAFRLPSIGL